MSYPLIWASVFEPIANLFILFSWSSSLRWELALRVTTWPKGWTSSSCFSSFSSKLLSSSPFQGLICLVISFSIGINLGHFFLSNPYLQESWVQRSLQYFNQIFFHQLRYNARGCDEHHSLDSDFGERVFGRNRRNRRGTSQRRERTTSSQLQWNGKPSKKWNF